MLATLVRISGQELARHVTRYVMRVTRHASIRPELNRILGDEVDQAAW
jgi:hypothetical protein